MVSAEFRTFYARLIEARSHGMSGTLQEMRALADQIMGARPLPEGVTAETIDAGGVGAILCRRDGHTDDAYLVYFHGGGFRLGSALSYRAFGAFTATVCGVQVLLVDYRLAPENPFPRAFHDAIRAYTWLVETVGCEQVLVGGDSAGGGLAAALILDAKDNLRRLPIGGILLSPWLDLTNRASSYSTKAETDLLFSKASADEAAGLYLDGADPFQPTASPLFGNWLGSPPLMVQASDAEVLMDDAIELARVVRAAGGDIELRIAPDMAHVWPIHYPAFPEAISAMDDMARFVDRVTA